MGRLMIVALLTTFLVCHKGNAVKRNSKQEGRKPPNKTSHVTSSQPVGKVETTGVAGFVGAKRRVLPTSAKWDQGKNGKGNRDAVKKKPKTLKKDAAWIEPRGSRRKAPCRRKTRIHAAVGSFGVIASRWKRSIKCQWSVRVPAGQRVELRVLTRTHAARTCKHGMIEVHDGSTKKTPLLQRLCAQDLPKTLVAKGSTVFLLYRSPHSKVHLSFLAFFTPISTQSSTTRPPTTMLSTIPTIRPTLPSSVAPPPDFLNRGCGKPFVEPNYRIVGGTDAVPFSFPWHVGLLYSNVINCGGSVISPRWILTAAHCLYDSIWQKIPINQLQIRVGDHDGQATEWSERDYDIEIIAIHDNFRPRYVQHDIALIKTTKDIGYNEGVLPVCLPGHITEPTSACIATGRGQDEDGVSARFLQQLRMIILPGESCRASYPLTWSQGMTCASKPGKGMCNGDSGGPLVCRGSRGLYIAGIVSHNDMCGLGNNKPTVFTDVFHYKSWALDTIEANYVA